MIAETWQVDGVEIIGLEDEAATEETEDEDD